MAKLRRCLMTGNPEESTGLVLTGLTGIIFGILIGLSLPTKLRISYGTFPIGFFPNGANTTCTCVIQKPVIHCSSEKINQNSTTQVNNMTDPLKIWVLSNPRGAERLPPGIVQPEGDLYLRRLWGKPSEDLKIKPKYLVAFTVGYEQKNIIDAAVKKFSKNFQILLFHYDGRTTEWDEFEWSENVIHVSARKQTKWWFAKRFLHPDIVAAYDYIFIWDEDLGLKHFDGEEYIKLVRKHGFEISQPALDTGGSREAVWKITEKRNNSEVHNKENRQRCPGPLLPPCAGFIEIMAPVFSREAWRCVWHMLQNDLVHGWGLDFALKNCVESAHEKIGVVDAQWILHEGVPSLGEQGEGTKAPWVGVSERCNVEWQMFNERLANAENAYYKSKGIDPSKYKPKEVWKIYN